MSQPHEDAYRTLDPLATEPSAQSPAGIAPPATTGEPTATLAQGDPHATLNPPVVPAEARPTSAIPGYEILGVLGRGGMGVVYQARHLALGRIVALKMILAGGHAGPEHLARFQAEAEAVARLQHAHIVQIFEVGQIDGQPFCALEYVEGGNLAQKLALAPLSPASAARLLETLALAMHTAHAHGIIHRDLKPANVLLTNDGGPKVTDFGLARMLDGDSGQTQSGAVLGTPSYMAPEQASGKAYTAGPAADVYALGAILYECLTGRPPFKGATPLETLAQVLHEEPVPPSRLQSKVPRDLETICLKCLRKEPQKRYGSAQVLAEELRRWQNGEPILARPTGPWERTWKWARRRPALAVLAAVLVLAVLGLVTGGVWFTVQLDQARAKAENHASNEEGLRAQADLKRREADDARKEANKQEGIARQGAEELKQKAKELRLELVKRQVAERRANEDAERLAITTGFAADDAWEVKNANRANELLQEIPTKYRGWEWRFRKRRFQGSYGVLSGHTAAVQSVVFSADGQQLASASADMTVRLWDARSGQQLRILQGHTAAVNSVAFRVDGQQLASASDDKTVRLWDPRNGRELLVLLGHTHQVHSVAFRADGQQLASGSDDKTVRLWDARSGQQRHILQGHTAPVNSVAFSPDGQRLASASRDNTVRLWDARSGQELRTLKSFTLLGVKSVAFSPDGQRLATSANLEGTVQLWDVRSGLELLTLQGPMGVVGGLAFSPDGQRLASVHEDKMVRLWDGSGKQLPLWDPHGRKERHILQGHTAAVNSVAFSPDGQRLASASADRTVRLWDTRKGQELPIFQGHTGHVKSVAFRPDGQQLASASTDKTVRLWDARSGQQLLSLQGHTDSVNSVAFRPDSQRLASAGSDKTVRLWDARSGQQLRILQGHTAAVNSVAFNPEGQRLASASKDKTVRLWDARNGMGLLTLQGHLGEVLSVAFSPDGQQLASACARMVRLWDVRSGKELLVIWEHTGGFSSVTFSPDSQRLASASVDKTVRLWDARSGQQLLVLQGHKDRVLSVAFSPDGLHLASASWDGTVRLWDARSGKQLLILRGHTSWVNSVAFSLDGLRLASASMDWTVRLWDARSSGQEQCSLQGHTDPVTCVAFSPDGLHLASASQDKTGRLWDIRSGQELLTLQGRFDKVNSMSFSPDGLQLASAEDETVRLWDARSGRQLHSFQGLTYPVSSLAFSADGLRLAIASGDQTVGLWDTGSGKVLLTLPGLTGEVSSMVFSPDGKRLASASWGGEVRLWDTRSGKVLLTLQGPTKRASSMAFSPDGQQLASAHEDKTVRLWDTRSGKQLHLLQGHTDQVIGVVFSPDGQKLFSRDLGYTTRAWDPKSGARLLSGMDRPIFRNAQEIQHPSQPILVIVVDNRIELIDLSPPDEFELGYRAGMASFDSPWQKNQAEEYEQAPLPNWYAAAFHWGQLAHHHPSHLPYWQRLLMAHGNGGDDQSALTVCDRLLKEHPGLAPVYLQRARFLARRFQFHAATADHLAALALVARHPVGWPEFAKEAAGAGDRFANAKDWIRAEGAFSDAILWERQNPGHRQRLAWIQLAAKQPKAFRALCQDLYANYRTTKDVEATYRLAAQLGFGFSAEPSWLRGLGRPVADALLESMQCDRNYSIVWMACLVADHGLPAETLVQLARKNVATHRSAEYLATLGAAQYRAGHFSQAEETLQEAVQLHGQGGTNSMKLFSAMSYHQLSQDAQARTCFAQASLAKDDWWYQRLIYHQLRAEAAQLLKLPIQPKN